MRAGGRVSRGALKPEHRAQLPHQRRSFRSALPRARTRLRLPEVGAERSLNRHARRR